MLLYELYWLPAIVEEEFKIHWMGIKIKIYRLIEFDNYIVNSEPPDSSNVVNQKVVYQIDPELEKIPLPVCCTKGTIEIIIINKAQIYLLGFNDVPVIIKGRHHLLLIFNHL